MNRTDTEHLKWVAVGGRRMYVDPADARAQAILSAGGPLHPDAILLWGHVVGSRDWDVVVDVGANYGEMLLAAPPPGSAAVVAVEPNERVIPALRATLAGAYPDSTLITAAISDVDGETTFHDDLTWWGNSTLCGGWKFDRPHEWTEVTVPTLRLSTLLKDVGANAGATVAIKLDIEGVETAVLRDSLTTLSRLGAYALLIEIVRMDVDELAWLADHFTLQVLENDTSRIVLLDEVAQRHETTLLDALHLPRIYRRDVVALPHS